MGYKTQYGGVLTITPPLNESEQDRLLGLCKLDNPRSNDVFAAVTQPTTEDRVILGSALEMLPWMVLFYEWRIGPCRKTDDHDLGECWTVEPPDSEISGGCGDVADELTFLHSWLKANGHELAGELGWSGSDAGGDTGTIYVDAVHGVEAVEDVHDNPGPSWASKAEPATKLKAREKASPELIEEARELWAYRSNDELEIDDDAETSRGEDGTWVQAWVWVQDSDLGPDGKPRGQIESLRATLGVDRG